jgi:hypothetical protein
MKLVCCKCNESLVNPEGTETQEYLPIQRMVEKRVLADSHFIGKQPMVKTVVVEQVRAICLPCSGLFHDKIIASMSQT